MIGDLLPSDPFACWVGIQFTRMGLDDDNWPVLDRVADATAAYAKLPGVYACVGSDCSCIFWPDIDGLGPDAYVYVDRWQPARRGPDGAPYGCEQQDCECHLLVHLGDDNRGVLDEIQPDNTKDGQPGASDSAVSVA